MFYLYTNIDKKYYKKIVPDEYLEWYWNTLKEIEEKQGLKGFTREEYQGRCVTLYEGRDY